MTDRQSCCVPFCGQTRRNDGRYAEWVCDRHWAPVSAANKEEHKRHQALLKKANRRRRSVPHIRARADAVWQRCKASAIEIAMGVSA